MPYITKKQLKSLDIALTMANSIINNNIIVMYKGAPTKWSEVSCKAGVALLELYQKRRQNNKKVQKGIDR